MTRTMCEQSAPSAVPIGQPSATVRRALSQAPIGEHGILEVALAWQQLRPTRHQLRRMVAAPPAGLATHRHLPIVCTEYEEIAVRLTRLLTGVTWAVVACDERDGSRRLRVEVPGTTYHRVIRTLTAVWRQLRDELGGADPGRAASLWRMALLIEGMPGRGEVLHLPTVARSTADLLARAACTLGVLGEVQRVHGGHGVVISAPGDLRRLLATTLGVLEPVRVNR
jgi:hypothetical protein